ncbi:hypothetical protein NQ317_004287 [Molorchus minor]|uniref:Peptidase S1 domain-containing protein n=1 Tax=Molorchus minor TaxID=1323400 RepID=A0ABQ9JFN1_9CUCU|nr:hypothetical protein NQ317_004287 [Molorchus minor]
MFIAAVSFLTVRAGSSTRGSGGKVVSVLQMTSHANYSKSTLDYDIGALLLSAAIDSVYSEAIALPSSGTGPASGETLTITGWGTTSESGSLATTPPSGASPCYNYS